MRLVCIESPLAGDVAANRAYLQECIRDCLRRGESPYASHLMLPEALDDATPEEREQGIYAGFAWRRVADATVIYRDLGISAGMMLGIANAFGVAAVREHAIEYRTIRKKEKSDE